MLSALVATNQRACPILAMLSAMPHVRIQSVCATCGELVAHVRAHTPGLLVLDLAVSHGGLDVLERLPPGMPTVVLAASGEQAPRAFDLGVTDFIVKPATCQRIAVAVSRAIHSRRARRLLGDPQDPVSPPRPVPDAPVCGTVTVDGISQLRWVRARGNYVRLHYTDRPPTLLRVPFSVLARSLPSSQFCRIHRSVIVRSIRVRELWEYPRPLAILDDGTELPVSRRLFVEVAARVEGTRLETARLVRT
jgi:DNA-binding LytR/AlgR family response regulator